MQLREEDLVDQVVLAQILGVSESWLEKRRSKGDGGPPYRKLGRKVKYYLPDVNVWFEGQKQE